MSLGLLALEELRGGDRAAGLKAACAAIAGDVGGSQLTPLLATDHVTNAFAELAREIAGVLDRRAAGDVVADLLAAGFDPIDVRLALAAARVLRGDATETSCTPR